jgi:hypothetical protein
VENCLVHQRTLAAISRRLKRARIVYFAAIAAAGSLFALAAALTFGLACGEWPCDFFRFLVVLLAAGSAAVAWGAAVLMASVYRVTWALYVNVILAVLAALAFAAWASHRSGAYGGRTDPPRTTERRSQPRGLDSIEIMLRVP